VIDFDRAIDTLTSGGITLTGAGPPIPANLTFSNGDRRVTLTPLTPLAASTVHTITVNAITDLTGLAIAGPFVSHFTTAAGVDLIGPQVTAISPANGAFDVPTNVLIEAAFSERMNALSINASSFALVASSTGIAVPGTYTTSADGRSASFT